MFVEFYREKPAEKSQQAYNQPSKDDVQKSRLRFDLLLSSLCRCCGTSGVSWFRKNLEFPRGFLEEKKSRFQTIRFSLGVRKKMDPYQSSYKLGDT